MRLALAAVPLLLAASAPSPPPLTPIDSAGLLRAVRDSGAPAVLVNVWATWCQPCREEMPDLLRLRREVAPEGLQILLVSADFSDQRDEARRFLAGLGVDFPSYIKNEADMAFIDAIDPEWSGALPASFVFDADGARREAWEGQRAYGEMREALLRVAETSRNESEEGTK